MSIANSEKQKSKPHQRNSTFSTNVICDTKYKFTYVFEEIYLKKYIYLYFFFKWFIFK